MKTNHKLNQQEEEGYSVKLFTDYLNKKHNSNFAYELNKEDPPDAFLLKNSKKMIVIECRDIVSNNIAKNKFESEIISKYRKRNCSNTSV